MRLKEHYTFFDIPAIDIGFTQHTIFAFISLPYVCFLFRASPEACSLYINLIPAAFTGLFLRRLVYERARMMASLWLSLLIFRIAHYCRLMWADTGAARFASIRVDGLTLAA